MYISFFLFYFACSKVKKDIVFIIFWRISLYGNIYWLLFKHSASFFKIKIWMYIS